MKYMGSKARIAKDILPIILKDRKPDQWYVEPFAGGMNSICEVDGLRLASDSNYYLIALWQALMSGWAPPSITKEEYARIREEGIRSFPAEVVGWAGICCSYSGKWFGGFAGKTATLSGVVRDYQKEALSNVSAQKLKLEGVVFKHSAYDGLHIPNGSIIYCDPPYKGTTSYKDSFDHEAFYEWCYFMFSLGHTIYVSEYFMPDDFTCVWEKEVKSSLSANGFSGGSKTSVEKLFTLL